MLVLYLRRYLEMVLLGSAERITETLMSNRTPILCDCCGSELMAERMADGRILIYAKRRGKTHHVIVDIDKKCYPERGNSVSQPIEAGCRPDVPDRSATHEP